MKQPKRKPAVGETLYRLNIGTAAHRREQKLVPVVVTSAGNKYFKCRPIDTDSSWDIAEFLIDTWYEKTNFSANYRIYETEQQWLDEQEHSSIVSKLRRLLGEWGPVNLTLQQLRSIQAIISEQ